MKLKDKIIIESINVQKNKIKKLELKKDKVFISFPKSMYGDDSRKPYIDGYNKDINKCNDVISELRRNLS